MRAERRKRKRDEKEAKKQEAFIFDKGHAFLRPQNAQRSRQNGVGGEEKEPTCASKWQFIHFLLLF